jgi:hypothetical protein
MVAFAFIVQFGLTMIACGVEVPGGLFVPSMILGASLGHLMGMAESTFLGGDPVIYALTGWERSWARPLEYRLQRSSLSLKSQRTSVWCCP